LYVDKTITVQDFMKKFQVKICILI
jgi:hypothetical protein